MQVRDIMAAVDRLAPFSLAEPWDHVGLQVGSPDDELRPPAASAVAGVGDAGPGPAGAGPAGVPVVLVALEVDDAVLDEARRLQARVVVSHHPLIFDPLERLSDDTEAGRLALRAAREGVAVIAAHTNLDKARGGMADIVGGMLGLEAVQPLQPASTDVLKLVGFVPEDDVDLVRKALFASGAGVIGEYEHCSWSVGGQGTFFGREGTEPVAGVAGRDEQVDELRLEVVFPRRLRRRVVGAYIAAHPYEEPAFDIVPLENEVASLGLGRLGALPAPVTLEALAAEVAAVLRLPSVRYAGDGSREVRRVAVLPGSGAEAIARGVAQVADVLVTGDVKYHEARAACVQGLALIDAPHGLTEQEGVLRWAEQLRDALGPAAAVETFRDPGVGVWSDAAVGVARAAVAGGDGRGEPQEEPALEQASTPGSETTPAAAGGPAPPTEAVRPVNRDDDRFRLYTDGGARGNPGPAGIGARLLTAGGDVVEEVADFIGTATNNVAEYQALLAGLEVALDRGVERLDVFLDSELVVRQVNGSYKVKDAGLKPLHQQACLLLSKFHEVDVKHVPREQNAAADALVNQAIDAAKR
ncbi:MAG: Nif3-like dinuclear metal center hexameric protein [Actinobacteria bacterium]|nr:Nif3-like dinuclear metal center hexameric protein [Actinomycetota bacterium]